SGRGYGTRALERGGGRSQHGHKRGQLALAKVRMRLEWPRVLETDEARGVRTIVREPEVEAHRPIRIGGRKCDRADRVALDCQVSDGSRDGSPWQRRRAGDIELDRQSVEADRRRWRSPGPRWSGCLAQMTQRQTQ